MSRNLNELPKDILIQLITTIEKDTREKIFRQGFTPHICGSCYYYYHPNHKWWCIIYEGKHSEGICNKCYSTFSKEGKERYVKCSHFKQN